MMKITSRKNSFIKEVVKLANRRTRDDRCLTMVEGVPEVSRALHCGIIPQEAYVCPDLLPPEAATAVTQLQQLRQTGQTRLMEVTTAVFAKIAYRGQSGGLLLVIPYLTQTLANLSLSEQPLVVVVENIEKPGNLGAILRTADAAGVDALIVCTYPDSKGTDLHNPNAIRSSLGTLFAIPIATAPTCQVIDWLRQHALHILVATPAATVHYTAVDMRGPTAIVTGSEARGLSQPWLEAADTQIVIPMYGISDSLNLSTATALLLYEGVRQRHQ